MIRLITKEIVIQENHFYFTLIQNDYHEKTLHL